MRDHASLQALKERRQPHPHIDHVAAHLFDGQNHPPVYLLQ